MKKNEINEAARRLSPKAVEALGYIASVSPTVDEVRQSAVDGRTLSPLVKKNYVAVKNNRFKITPSGTKVHQAASVLPA